MRSCGEYLQGLEEERQKIQVFQRELPLCLELVTQAIDRCKQQLLGKTNECDLNDVVQYECSVQTSSDVPVLEEFMPIKRDSVESGGEEQESKKQKNGDNSNVTGGKNGKKSDWLRSVQLWNQTPDPPGSLEDSPRKLGHAEAKTNGNCGAFHPFKKDRGADDGGNTTPPQGPVDVSLPPASTSSTAGSGGGNKKEGHSQTKTRRCWSPELHRRFLQALQQLGGSHVASPKQIRDLMKVDGLTNDEVKSHLQKYRLHTRRPSSVHSTTNNTHTPQFLVVGGIWMPPEYAATTTSGEASGVANSNGVYAPIATLPPPFQEAPRQHKPSNSGERLISHSEGHVQSHSPVTSSSTHSTIASPAY